MLEKLFTSKNRIKIIGFYLFEKKSAYLREISERLKMPVSAVKRETDNLIQADILKKDNKNIFLNNESKVIEELKSIFIKTDYLVHPIKEELNDTRIKFAFIFGSYAKGNYNEESDIDLFIIGDIKQEEIFNKIKNAEKKIKKEINPIVWKIEDLKKKKYSAFIKTIKKDRIIMMRGEENEFRRIIEE